LKPPPCEKEVNIFEEGGLKTRFFWGGPQKPKFPREMVFEIPAPQERGGIFKSKCQWKKTLGEKWKAPQIKIEKSGPLKNTLNGKA